MPLALRFVNPTQLGARIGDTRGLTTTDDDHC